VVGFSGLAAADASIWGTGPWSNNKVSGFVSSHFRQTNNNNVRVNNSNNQTATTGNAFVGGNTGGKHFKTVGLFDGCKTWQPNNWQSWNNKGNDCLHRMLAGKNFGGNTFGGSATTGNASNWNQTAASVAISNSTPWTPSWGGGGGGSASISDTGPKSNNVISERVSQDTNVRNNNNVSLNNRNNQVATTGNANVSGNTFGGSASTGDAMNANSTNAAVQVDNNTNVPTSLASLGSGGSAFIGDTGPLSNNVISANVKSNTSVTNNNNVNINNSNNQVARSGNANVSGNTFGGSASTGDASNWNSTDLQVAITNN